MVAMREQVLLQIAKERKFQSPEITITGSENNGYLSNVNLVTIKDGASDNTLRIFIKEKTKEATDIFLFLYRNEALFYNKVIGEFDMLLKKCDLTLPNIPKCYLANDEFIILEDITSKGYKLWNPLNQSLDSIHIKTVLEAYGKFHAFSFALKYKKPEQFKSIGLKFDLLFDHYDILKDMNYFENINNIIFACFDSKEDVEYIDALKKFLTDDQLSYLKRLNSSEENHVYIHGDNWTHNYMFQYDDNNQLKECCMVDFQLFQKISPVVDLSIFLAISACSDEVFGSIWEYLKVYHESLKNNLTKLRCPSNLYTWKTLKEEWLTYALKGFIVAAQMMKVLIADKDEMKAREDIPLPMKFVFISRNEEIYKKRMRILVKYFYEAGCFPK